MLSADVILLRMTVGYSLVDITQTNVVASIHSKDRNQQRNWETLVQVLGLRVQLLTISEPVVVESDLAGYQFGAAFSGVHKVWSFRFGIEQEGIYSNATRPYGTLESDFVNVPVILGLDETVSISTPTFTVSGPNTNIYFEPFSI